MEWEKIRKELAEKKNEETIEDSLITEVPAGRELSDVYLRHPGNESSTDSEGEEINPRGNRGSF